MTTNDFQSLRPGQVLVAKDGKRWRVNGQVKIWKTRPYDFRVPLKYGLYAYGYAIPSNMEWFTHIEGQ